MPEARTTEVDPLGVINLIGSNLLDKYPLGSILKELLQNADDAGAKKVIVGWTPGPVDKPKHQLLQGPALFVANDGKFTANDAHAICRFGQNYKFGEKAVIGKFGLGLKSVFHLCEAFFYLSSTSCGTGEDPGLFNNLASPWANTDYHRGWNTVAEGDLASLRSFLRPVWERLGADWFVLWLPLRRSDYCDAARFIGRYDGEGRECPTDLGMAAKGGNIARTLPLLHSIESFEFWERWMPGDTQPTAGACLETVEIRSRFRACVRANADDCGVPTAGRYTTSYGQTVTVTYSLAQSWTPDLLELSGDDHWPKSFVLGSGQLPDKAQPHGAVLLARRADRKAGGLDVATAVFLPLEASVRNDAGESEFLLTLHGCFFIDSGRRHALHAGGDVRGKWNRLLMAEGVLPLVIPAIEAFARANDDSETLARLTWELERWTSEEDRREHVCGKYGWLHRWHKDGQRWECVESSTLILEIPAFGNDAGLPVRAMPRLSDASQQLVLTPARQPRLTRCAPGRWPDEVIGPVLTIDNPESLYQDGGTALEYYHEFVESLGEIGDPGRDALRATVHNAFARVGTGALRGTENPCRDWTRALVRRLPSNSRLGLALGGNWPDDARRDICGSVSRILIVPEEFEPNDSPGTGRLTIDEAVGVLERLAPHTTASRNSNPSLAVVINSADVEQVLRRTEGLRLWKVDRVTAKGGEPEIVSRAELMSSLAVFAGELTQVVGLLADVLAAGKVWVIPTEVARVVLPGALTADVGGVLAFLASCPPLADIGPNLIQLFEVLRPERNDSKWRVALRYLLHRRSDIPPDDECMIGDQREDVWGKLASAALNAKGNPGLMIPTNGITRALDPFLREALGISLSDAPGVARLVAEVGPTRITISVDSGERDEVIRGFQQHPELIRGLPLHDRADGGGMTRITENCYWEGTGKPGTLTRHLQLLRQSDDEVLAAIQRKAHPAQLTPVEVVRQAIQHGPADHWDTLLSALQSSGTLSRDLQDKLKNQAWLPLAVGGKVSPTNVLHDAQFDDPIVAALRAIERTPNDPVSQFDLSAPVREHNGFRELARQLFPDRKQLISRLASVLRRDSRYRIGRVDLRSQEERNHWIEAFREAPPEVMGASSLFCQVNKLDPNLCADRLLPPLSDDSIPQERLERILAFLRESHRQGRGDRSATLRIHNLYLRLAAEDRLAFRSLLPRLKLLSETGEWSDPADLCVAEGLDPARTLDSKQEEILGDRICSQALPLEVPNEQPEKKFDPRTVYFPYPKVIVAELTEYFDNWKASEKISGWAGAILSLLGDMNKIKELAIKFLELAGSKHSIDYIRKKTIGNRQFESYGILTDHYMEKFKQVEIYFKKIDSRKTIQVTGIIGNKFKASYNSDFTSLFLGPIKEIKVNRADGSSVLILHFRLIDPEKINHDKLRKIIASTGDRILKDFYGFQDINITFDSVLEEFDGEDEFGVRFAQAFFLEGAIYSLRTLGLANSKHPPLQELMRESEKAVYAKAEEQMILSVDNRKNFKGDSDRMESVFRDKLRELVAKDSDVQAELVKAVRRKVRENRYELRSVLFELFQNADDAYQENGCQADPCPVFVCHSIPGELVILHNGRRINRTIGDNKKESNAHSNDLLKMLSLGHSDKALGSSAKNVTGCFGLGFKSVFFLTDKPQIVSGRIAVEVVGGVYPIPIKSGCANALRDRIEKVNLPRETGTIFRIPVRADVDLKEVVDPFGQMLHYLVVFARRIRKIQFQQHIVTWIERPIISVNNTCVAEGLLKPVSEGASDPRRAIVFRCGLRGDVLFGLNESGFTPVPGSIPSVWVTAPTGECHGVGYLVNAPLDLDVGRSQVTWDSANNTDRLKDLGRAVGDALIELFDAGTSGLGVATNALGVWQSLWEIVSRPGDRRELHKALMWGESGAATRLYSQRSAIPTGVAAGQHHTLTSIPNIKYVLVGTLDAEGDERLLSRVVSWDGFDSHYPPGSVVSDQKVWSRLREWCPGRRPQNINLATIVGNDLQSNPDVSPERAARLGAVIDRDLLRRMEHGPLPQRSEYSRLEPLLRSKTRFRTQDGSWARPDMLLVPPETSDPDRREEALRSAFAPPERVLTNTYVGTGVEFFLACRNEMYCPLDEMARWARTADSKNRRSAVVTYLREGQQHYRLQQELQRIGIEGTWLAEIDREDLRRAGFDDREQTATLVRLGVVPPMLTPTAGSSVQQPRQPGEVQSKFSRIATWWEGEGADRIRDYNSQIYPDGCFPNLTSDEPGHDHDSRIEWLKFFVTCIVQTAGRVTLDQNRTFLQLCETERWLDTLSDNVNGPREWLAAIQHYIDSQSGDGIPYFHWLRHFVGVATVSRHLDAYADSFLSINRFEGRFTPRDTLSIRTSRQFQFGGPDAPTLVPILGIGACFALRELFRMKLVNRDDVRPFCYPAVARLRRFLEGLGWQDDEKGSPSERSRSIFEFIAMHHPNDPTFGNAFDIPILMYMDEHRD